MAARWPTYPPCYNHGCKTPGCCARGYKYTWPDLVGKDSLEAKATIEHDNPLVSVVFVKRNQGWLMDYCCNRFYVFLDENSKVSSKPFLPMIIFYDVRSLFDNLPP
ncbi:hypothetical protein Sango_2968900 [Sesamum angolense]|uniref:Uncharacterized protein n=1 Tax=Sesamum angolense TaxID=2727404 RepID=A0AAE1T3T8_9LAMI|nr:hypothetical protein Sango_2968900 [Sesamum angolense]